MKKGFKHAYLMVLLLSIVSCENDSNSQEKNHSSEKVSDTTNLGTVDVFKDTLTDLKTIPQEAIPCDWDTYLLAQGLVNIRDVDTSILVELKYSTTDNFMQRDMYGCLENCYLQPDVAERLKICQNELKSRDSTLSLLVYDGLRPRLVQQFMWDLLDMPLNEKTKFVSNPANGSLHNFAAAVDITLIDLKTNQPLDMGTPYDYIGVLAWPTKEAAMLKDSLLTQEQVDNRILLRKVMQAGKFFNIQTEWWHFNACYRDKAKELYHIIEGDTSLIKI